MLRSGVLFLLLACAAAAEPPQVLVYTRNYTPDHKGYVHNNIAASVDAIRKIGAEAGFVVHESSDPALFNDATLKQYRAIVFSNSNNVAFDTDDQRHAFQKFIRHGGGLVGIHSATGSERTWPYFWRVMGGHFLRHPRLQKFTVRVVDKTHPATRDRPATFEWDDECYYNDNLSPDLKPLLVVDPAKLDDPKKAEYPGDRFKDSMPLAWYQTVEGGRQFYTALGHKIEHYSDPLLVKQIRGGILWVLEGSKKK